MRTLQHFVAFLAVLTASSVAGSTTPYSVATLVTESDPAMVQSQLSSHVADREPLVRATAARVAAARSLTALVPALRSAIASETDATAAREQLRALAILGTKEDVELAIASAQKWPAAMDNAVAIAVARRGAAAALELYHARLRATRMTNRDEFFRVALWSDSALIPFASTRLIADGDEAGWRGLLDALRHSSVAMHGPMMTAALGSPSEDIRTASVWFLVRGYAVDPAALPAIVRETLSGARDDVSSDREDFGRELLRRMLGAEKKDHERWQRFLATEEADQLLLGETAALQYLTDLEYAVRFARCEVQTQECELPEKRTNKTIPSEPVAPPAFDLPSELPAGLADAIVRETHCRDSWIGVADASVDRSGRIRSLNLEKVYTRASCKRAIDILLRLSLATNTSIKSGFSGPVLLVHPSRTSLCVDEESPDVVETSTHRAGGAVQPPKPTRQVEPRFPPSAVEKMGGGRNVIVIAEALVTKAGCVRNLRIIEQSPYPELNGAALMGLAQWQFRPGYLDGKPVDVRFNLTMNFKVP
jgi:outer membrane biosynthesis protein TonB